MIDLHCHLLPGIDDGPQTLEEALDLARLAVAAGIHTAVLTPHVHPGRWDNDLNSIKQNVAAFRIQLKEHGIPLKILPGGEVRLSADIIDMEGNGVLPFIGHYEGYRVILLEFPHGILPVGSDKLVRWLLSHKILPLIAHPERNKEIMRDPEKIYPFVAMGCLLQVTGAALTGGFGAKVQETALSMLDKDWVSVVATDAHNIDNRPPILDMARAALIQIGGEALAVRLTETTPGIIIEGIT